MEYEDDPKAVAYPFIVVKIDGRYVVCDKGLPNVENLLEGTIQAAYSYHKRGKVIPYIEKALAVYLGGYTHLASLKDLIKIF